MTSKNPRQERAFLDSRYSSIVGCSPFDIKKEDLDATLDATIEEMKARLLNGGEKDRNSGYNGKIKTLTRIKKAERIRIVIEDPRPGDAIYNYAKNVSIKILSVDPEREQVTISVEPFHRSYCNGLHDRTYDTSFITIPTITLRQYYDHTNHHSNAQSARFNEEDGRDYTETYEYSTWNIEFFPDLETIDGPNELKHSFEIVVGNIATIHSFINDNVGAEKTRNIIKVALEGLILLKSDIQRYPNKNLNNVYEALFKKYTDLSIEAEKKYGKDLYTSTDLSNDEEQFVKKHKEARDILIKKCQKTHRKWLHEGRIIADGIQYQINIEIHGDKTITISKIESKTMTRAEWNGSFVNDATSEFKQLLDEIGRIREADFEHREIL